MIKKKEGYFLVELVAIITIVSICMLPIATAIAEAVNRSMTNEIKTTAISLAEGVMEEIMNKTFTGAVAETATSFSAPFSTYAYEVECDYVDSSDLDTPAGTQTEYKLIKVNISHNGNRCVQLIGLKTDYANKE